MNWIRALWRRWHERGQSVAFGIDVGAGYASIATATRHRDGSVHYHVKQIDGDAGTDWGQALREYWDEIAGRVGAEQAAAFHDALYGRPVPGQPEQGGGG